MFSEKMGAEGEVTRKKARLVTKGFMEVWGEDYWHTYSPTLGHDTLFSCLAYTAIGTCLDIMYAIHSLSQFSIAPGPVHLMALKHVYHYLNGMQDLGITFNGNQLQDGLVTYSDSDWAGDLNSCRSISGYVFILCGAIVAWSTKKQMMLALSSTKAEYMAMTHTGKEVAFLKHTLMILEYRSCSQFPYSSIISPLLC